MIVANKEKIAAKIVASFEDPDEHFYAMLYWDFIMARRAEKPSIDAIGYDKALAIRAQLINV